MRATGKQWSLTTGNSLRCRRRMRRRPPGAGGVVAVLSVTLLSPNVLLAAYTADGQWHPSPDQPLHYYWLRTDRGVPAEAESMDARLADICEVFGRGDFEQTRELAQGLLDTSDDPALRGEAVCFIVQSHLAQGELETARSEAKRLGDEKSLAQIKKLEDEYKAEVGRLQHIVATTRDAGEAARAQLLTARAHERAYRFALAQQSYWKVVNRYPGQAEAGDAVWQIAQMQRARGNVESALSACLSAAAQFPNSRFISAAAGERIATLSVAERQTGEGAASLLDLARRFPKTVLSAWARYYLGELHWRADRADQAAEAWKEVWEYEPYATQIADLLERLAEARYRAGTRARSSGEFEYALIQLSFLAAMPETQWRRQHVLPASLALERAECHLGLEQWQEALDLAGRSRAQRGQPGDAPRALYVEGCAYWGLHEYDAAVQAWATAIDQYPATEYANKSQERMRP